MNHFPLANGFPPKTYDKIFARLAEDFEIGFLERHGHNPKFPVSDGWKFLKDELKEEISTKYEQPIIGIGHSLGGILHLLVAAENPELYKQIILLDAPIISRFSSRSLQILKITTLIDRYSPSKVTRFRRNRWETKQEAFEHFKQKFRAFDEDVLRDYVEHGLINGEDGFELFFAPKIEARIYRTIPHHLPKLKGKLKVPTAYIGGTNSREARLAKLSFMQKHFPIDFHFLKGTHLFPFEIPEQTAEKIKEIIFNLS
ncbi:MAG TPA: alpha/beta hydrolase [Pyrinomonadaceae bacterium]|nr:alpha/beta hydrolase [Pyrinomonadaceae bacterium]